MSLPKAFQPFVEGAPCAVMARLAAEWLIDGESLRMLFEKVAENQYERELTLDQLVAVMLDVACGTRPSPRAAYLARQEEIAVSLTAFYGKLRRTEPAIAEAVVAHTAERAREVIRKTKGLREEPVSGFHSFVLDGNVLGGTEHRLKPLRQTRAAALPGKSLALFECATGVVTQAVLEEDAYVQERALLPRLDIESGVHLLADRNFCVPWFLMSIQKAGSFFTIRRHRGSFPVEPVGKPKACGRCATGSVSEQTIRVRDEEGQVFFWRMITLSLDEPTRDGDTEIVLITNLPRRVRAATIASAYRKRWTIEHHFQLLTQWLHCEVPSLGHPRAALFAFAMSVVAGNTMAILEAALRAKHGATAAVNLSYWSVVEEISATYRGMMIALPARRWRFIHDYSPYQAARLLCEVAGHADMQRMRKNKRGPKKPRRTPNCKRIRDRSTRRLLDAET